MVDSYYIVIRLALYAALLPMFGLTLFGLYGLSSEDRGTTPAVPLGPALIGSAGIAFGLSAVGLLLSTAMMMGVAPRDVAAADIWASLTEMAAGSALLVRAAALAAVIAATLAWTRWPVAALIAAGCASGVALATLAWAGHGAADFGRLTMLHAAADIAHLLGAGAWLGGLLGLGMLLFRSRVRQDITYRALTRFAGFGTASVATLVLSGIINSWVLIGFDDLSRVWTTAYGRLLAIKLVLFAGMLVLAAVNRFRLAPALGAALRSCGAPVVVRRLRVSLASESGLAIGILALVAWLGTLAPPAGP